MRLGSSDELYASRQIAIAQRLHGDNDGALVSLERALALCHDAGKTASLGCIAARAHRAHLLARNGHGAQALQEAQAADDALPKNTALYSEISQIKQARRRPASVAQPEKRLRRGAGGGGKHLQRFTAIARQLLRDVRQEAWLVAAILRHRL